MSRKKNRTLEQQMRVDQQNSYDEFNTEQIKLKLNRKTDADVLDWLRKQQWSRTKSMQSEIKRLIREEIAREAAEICQCTPTETGRQISNENSMNELEINQYLSRPDVRKYLLRYPDVTNAEKIALFQWLKDGHDFGENSCFLADDSGRTMDFIQGERAMMDMQDAALG